MSAIKIYTDVRHERTAVQFRIHGITRSKDLDGLGLTEKQRATVCMYLGFDGLQPTSMPAIAVISHTTKQAVHQLLYAALRKVMARRYPTKPE
jgi:DNA-directed RNA polymerase sigma subunit (sigma70/sigma32)